MRDLIDLIVLRFKEHSITVKNIHAESMSELNSIDIFDNLLSSKPVETVQRVVLKIDAVADEYKVDLHEEEGAFANFIRPFIQSVNASMDGAGNMTKSYNVRVVLDYSETEELTRFMKDPDYYTYSKEFDELIKDLLSRR